MKMRKLGKGDSDLTKKLDKEAEKGAAQARKFDRYADDAKYDRIDKDADKLDKGPKSKNPDVDDYGKTKADKVRDGNVKSKDAEKVRRKDVPLAKTKQKVVLVQPIEMLQDRVMHIQGIKQRVVNCPEPITEKDLLKHQT